MKGRFVVALGLSSLVVAGLLQVAATAAFDDPLPCRDTISDELVDKVKSHGEGKRRICQVGKDTAVATVTDNQLQDDSVRASRHVLTLQRRQGAWKVIEDLHIQKCQEGRGHQAFSRKPCI